MVDKKSPDENLFNDNFDTEFDLGAEPESENTADKLSYASPTKPKMKLLILSAMVILLLTLYMGWRFLNKSTPEAQPMMTETTEPAHKPEMTNAELPKTEATALSSLPELAPQIKPKPENPLHDIAQAFSSADQTPQAAPKDNAATLKDLQKELFSPSQPGNVPTPGSEAAQISEATNAMINLSQQLDYTIAQIKQLDAYTREISTSISKLNTDISAMDNRILAVTHATSSLSKDLGSVKSEVNRYKPMSQAESFESIDAEPLGRKRPTAPGCPTPEEAEYMVHAVIPGRAWLKTSKGQIITVTEGETVGNYGKVLVIDAANGVVLTNSGITFR